MRLEYRVAVDVAHDYGDTESDDRLNDLIMDQLAGDGSLLLYIEDGNGGEDCYRVIRWMVERSESKLGEAREEDETTG